MAKDEIVAEAPEKTVTITESALLTLIENFKSGEGKGQKVEQEVDPRMTAAYIDELAFMEELVDVVVHTSTEKHAAPVIVVRVNGRPCQFPRGITVRCPRYFVDGLIVKTDQITTPQIEIDGPTGKERSCAISKTSGLRYPFSVIQDKNKKGPEWLKRRLAEVV